MTVGEVLEIVKYTNETMLPDSLLCRWLAEHDGRVLQEDYLRNGFEVAYDPELDAETKLLIDAPWDGMYISWIQQKIHFSRGEYQDAADCRNDWDTMHQEWVRHMLNTTPTDCCGRPILLKLAFCRRGSDCNVHLIHMFRDIDIQGVELWIRQGEMNIELTDNDAEITILRGGIQVHISAAATALLNPGSCKLICVLHTVAGERYEADPAQINIMDSNVQGA